MIWRKRSKQQLFLSEVIKLVLILFGVNLSCNSNLQHSSKIILIEKEGIFFNEKTNKPYTGEIVKYYKNGEKYTSRSYLEGKKNGFHYFWHANGQIGGKENWNEGKRDGEWKSWYKNGQIKAQGMWNDGLEDGEWELFYKDGQLKDSGYYLKGKKHGLEKRFHSNGVHKVDLIFKDGVMNCNYMVYDSLGKKVEETSMVDGKLNGKQILWHGPTNEECLRNCGKIMGDKTEIEYKNNIKHGVSLFFRNEKLLRKETYLKGKKHGPYEYYRANGKMSREGFFIYNGATSTWSRWYDNEGNLEHSIGEYGKEWYPVNEDSIRIAYEDSLRSTYTNDVFELEINGKIIVPIISEFVIIEGGTIQMGSNYNENQYERGDPPLHDATVSSFLMSKTEVTFEEYDVFCVLTGRIKPDDEGWGRGERPVINVSWYDATEYCEWLSNATGKSYRLPTNKEWEFAARGGNKDNNYEFSGSNNIDSVAWNAQNSDQTTHPVGQKLPNELGIYDMTGNVSEWCFEFLPNRLPPGSTDVTAGDRAFRRGGSAYDNSYFSQLSYPQRIKPHIKSRYCGFRLVLDR